MDNKKFTEERHSETEFDLKNKTKFYNQYKCIKISLIKNCIYLINFFIKPFQKINNINQF